MPATALAFASQAHRACRKTEPAWLVTEARGVAIQPPGAIHVTPNCVKESSYRARLQNETLPIMFSSLENLISTSRLHDTLRVTNSGLALPIPHPTWTHSTSAPHLDPTWVSA